MGAKSECCKRYKRKGRPCKTCPKLHGLSKKETRKVLKVLAG